MVAKGNITQYVGSRKVIPSKYPLKFLTMEDADGIVIVSKYRVERKEYGKRNRQRAWVIGWKPGWGSGLKVRPGANAVSSDK